MDMLMGEYTHNIDAKGRLTLPSKFRDTLGTSVVVTRGFEGCLNVYSISEWQKIFEKLMKMPSNKKETRTFIRLFTSKATEVEFDKLGRINLPNQLIQHANLLKACTIVGAGNHLEIWNAEAWEQYYEEENENFESISESLDGFDF